MTTQFVTRAATKASLAFGAILTTVVLLATFAII
jgi:hypothetical protein